MEEAASLIIRGFKELGPVTSIVIIFIYLVFYKIIPLLRERDLEVREAQEKFMETTNKFLETVKDFNFTLDNFKKEISIQITKNGNQIDYLAKQVTGKVKIET